MLVPGRGGGGSANRLVGMPENSQLPDPVPSAGWEILPPANPSAPQFVEIPGVRGKHKAMFWGLLGVVVLIFLVSAVAVAVKGVSSWHDVDIPLIAVSAGLFLPAFFIAMMLIPTVLYIRRKQAVAKAAQPESVVFLTQNTRELRVALKTLGYGRKQLGLLPVVTVGPAGIELRRSTRPSEACTILPRGNISHIHPCHFIIFNGRRRFPVLTMMVSHTSNGQLMEIPLPIMGPNGLMFAYPPYANFLLGAVARYCTIV